MAPPSKPVDLPLLEKLAALGLTIPEMAAVMRVSHDTLERNYLDVIDEGKQKCKASVRRKQFELAMAGNPTMLIWLGKQILGQKDQVNNQLSNADGTPLPTIIVQLVKTNLELPDGTNQS